LEEFQTEEARPEAEPSAQAGRVSLARTFGGRSVLREVMETVLLTVILFVVINAATARSQVNGTSMEPTLHDGQYLIISRLAYWIHPPERGDIIVLHPPTNPGEDYIKRIVGLPGEQVEVRDGRVWIDGIILDEPYVLNLPAYTGSWTLGVEEYLVLGDNRGDSDDSHQWGPLSMGDIVGKAWMCYWPPEQWGPVEHYVFPKVEE
jgi:signal peptidase I